MLDATDEDSVRRTETCAAGERGRRMLDPIDEDSMRRTKAKHARLVKRKAGRSKAP